MGIINCGKFTNQISIASTKIHSDNENDESFQNSAKNFTFHVKLYTMIRENWLMWFPQPHKQHLGCDRIPQLFSAALICYRKDVVYYERTQN